MPPIPRFLKSMGRSGCALLPLLGHANAQELPPYIKNTSDISDFTNARAAGKATQQQSKQAAEAFDSIGTGASHAVAVAGVVGNPVAGLPAAVMGSALMPIVKSERERLEKIASVQAEFETAVQSGDYSRISELQKRADAITAEGATWHADYGSSKETIVRLAEGVEVDKDNQPLATVFEIGKRVLSMATTAEQSPEASSFKAAEQQRAGPTPSNGVKRQLQEKSNTSKQPSPVEAKKPDCGSMGWYNQVGSADCADTSPPPPSNGGMSWRISEMRLNDGSTNTGFDTACYPSNASTLKQFALDNATRIFPTLKQCRFDAIESNAEGDGVLFTYACPSNRFDAAFSTKMGGAEIQATLIDASAQIPTPSYTLVSCSVPAKPDCSAEGKKAWANVHFAGAENVQCMDEDSGGAVQ